MRWNLNLLYYQTMPMCVDCVIKWYSFACDYFVGVLAEKGCGVDLLINIGLTCLGYIPGIIHAIYIIAKY